MNEILMFVSLTGSCEKSLAQHLPHLIISHNADKYEYSTDRVIVAPAQKHYQQFGPKREGTESSPDCGISNLTSEVTTRDGIRGTFLARCVTR